MPRPNKVKRVGKVPARRIFYAAEQSGEPGAVLGAAGIIMGIEEFETIRLIDYLGLTQAEAACRMNVGRTTVQSLYTSARRKIARYIVEGSFLTIDTANCMTPYMTASAENNQESAGMFMKGEFNMKIAVTYENGQVFQHFGHTEQFKLYTVEDGKITGSEVVDTNGSGHGALASFLKEHGVDTLICGGIGAGAKNALAEMGIELFAGAAGDADAQAESFLAGNLVYDPNTECSHHHGSHEHHGNHCGHGDCGSHGDHSGHHGCQGGHCGQ